MSQAYTLEDIGKVYDNFFKDHFKGHPQSAEIQNEYNEFKNELMQFAKELSEEDFNTYASRKKYFLRGRIQELSGPHAIEGRLNMQPRRGYFFDFLRTSSIDTAGIDAYLQTYNPTVASALVTSGSVAHLHEFGKSQDSIVAKDIKRVTELESEIGNGLATLLRKDLMSQARILDFGQLDHSLSTQILVSMFTASLEKNIYNVDMLTDYLVDLHNLAVRFSKNTDHYPIFTALGKYFQQLLIDATSKKFSEDSSYHAYLLGLYLHTLHHERVYRGLKHLALTMMKTALQFCDLTLLIHMLKLRHDESAAEAKLSLLEFFDSVVDNDRLTSDNYDIYKSRVLRMVNLLGYCLNGSFKCSLITRDSNLSVICTPYESSEENSNVYILIGERKSILAYTDSQKALVDILKKAEPTFGLEDFLSLSDRDGDDYTDKGMGVINLDASQGENSNDDLAEAKTEEVKTLPQRFQHLMSSQNPVPDTADGVPKGINSLSRGMSREESFDKGEYHQESPNIEGMLTPQNKSRALEKFIQIGNGGPTISKDDVDGQIMAHMLKVECSNPRSLYQSTLKTS